MLDTRSVPFKVLFCVAALGLLVASAALAVPPVSDVDANGNVIRPICLTDQMWMEKKATLPAPKDQVLAVLPPCAEGNCDDPVVRDAGDQSAITINCIVHVINDSDGTPPNGVTQAVVDAQMAEMNQDYAPFGIQFNYTTEFHNDGNYYCVSKYTPGGGYYSDIQSAKATYFHDTATNLNILVTCQDSSPFGILLGFGTFPWDPDALTTAGGLWVNSAYFGSGNKTLTHEAGHNLGLWHTHHGVDEVGSCSDPCRENVHALTDPDADLRGDFAKDTQATPTNYNCSDPSGTDCNNVSWGFYGDAVYHNFMGYGPDNCINEFTADQGGRMHCWTRDQLSGWFGQGCTDPAPNAPSSLTANAISDSQIDLTWADNSSNEDGFRIERDAGGGFTEIATVGANVTSYSDAGLTCETSYTYQVRAYNCGGNSAYSNSAGATTGTCPPGPTMHVSSIDLSIRQRGPWTNAEGYVTIVDEGGSPVSGAVVDADWTGTTSSSQSVTTQSDGRAFFESDRVRNASSYCWTLTVTNVTLAGATYDSGANVETSDQVGNNCGAARIAQTDVFGLRSSPNPFNPTTILTFDVYEAGNVSLNVYDAAGRLVATLANEHMGVGTKRIEWNGQSRHGSTVPSGVYYARLEIGGSVQTHRMVLLK